MNLIIAARRRGFRIADRLAGGPIQEHLSRIERLMAPDAQAREERESALDSILRHAGKTTEYYGSLPANPSLSNFPVSTKLDIRSAGDKVLSHNFNPKSLTSASTTGSTGTPFRVLQDKRKRQIRNAETIYFGAMADFYAGFPLYHFKVWSERNRKSPLYQSIRNVRPVDVVSFDEAQMDAVIEEMMASPGEKAIIAYSSALERFCKYLESKSPVEHRLDAGIISIITQSEPLSQETRESAFRLFGIRPVSRYGAEEVGIIGQETADDPGFLLNAAGVFVEVLNLTEDADARPGELGRIVVTDLNNYAMPMIRYDTGDLGRFKVGEGQVADTRILERLEGRQMDQIFDTSSRHVSSFVFYKCVWKYPEIVQFQLAQTHSSRYRIRLNVDRRAFTREANLVHDFKKHLGVDAEVDVQYVATIPLLRSGKQRQVVNEMAG